MKHSRAKAQRGEEMPERFYSFAPKRLRVKSLRITKRQDKIIVPSTLVCVFRGMPPIPPGSLRFCGRGRWLQCPTRFRGRGLLQKTSAEGAWCGREPRGSSQRVAARVRAREAAAFRIQVIH